jgi:hypothetical protein
MSEQSMGLGGNSHPRMQERLEGLANLLGIGLAELDPIHYPDSVQLPSGIHQPAYESLQQTLEDDRERQLSYDYRDSAWKVGIEIGPREKASDAYIRSRSLLSNIHHSILKRPLVALHTHPRVSDEVITALMNRHADRENWGAQDVEDWYRHYRTVGDINASFPSPDDVRVAHSRFPKELVQMLYTPFSSFMMVRTNLSGKRQEKFTSERYLARRWDIGKYRNTIVDVLDGYSVAEERSKLLKALSVALGDEYSVFYSFAESADSTPPVLEKYPS